MPANALGIVEGANLTCLANVAIAEFLRCNILATGKYAIAGLTEIGEVIAMSAAEAADKYFVGRDLDADGTQYGIAAVAIAVGDTIYSAAAGQITNVATATGFKLGVAMSAASGAGVAFTWKRKTIPVANP